VTTGLLTAVVAVQLGTTPVQAGKQVYKLPIRDAAENSAVFEKRDLRFPATLGDRLYHKTRCSKARSHLKKKLPLIERTGKI
jgi:hypothetical protein